MIFFNTGVMPQAGLVLTGVLVILTTGCSTFEASQKSGLPETATSVSASLVRQYQENIELGGRLSLRYEQDGLERVIDGKFTWSQTPELTRIALSTPFGQTLAEIDVTPSLSRLTQNGQAPRSEHNVDTLTASALGWPLPIAGLRNWLQGFAVNRQGTSYIGSPASTGDARFVNTSDGWLIHYPLWEAGHPKRIDLQRLTSEAGNVRLRIVLDQWQENTAQVRKTD